MDDPRPKIAVKVVGENGRISVSFGILTAPIPFLFAAAERERGGVRTDR